MKEEEVVTDEFHFVEGIVDRHRLGGVFLDAHDAAGLVVLDGGLGRGGGFLERRESRFQPIQCCRFVQRDGRLVATETILEGGVAAFPDALLGLFDGVNTGKLLLEI